MNTQVAFTIDEKLKKMAMQRAKQKWIPLKSFLVYCIDAFVKGKLDLWIKVQEDDRDTQYTKENHKVWLNAKKDLEKGENIVSMEDLKTKYTE